MLCDKCKEQMEEYWCTEMAKLAGYTHDPEDFHGRINYICRHEMLGELWAFIQRKEPKPKLTLTQCSHIV